MSKWIRARVAADSSLVTKRLEEGRIDPTNLELITYTQNPWSIFHRGSIHTEPPSNRRQYFSMPIQNLEFPNKQDPNGFCQGTPPLKNTKKTQKYSTPRSRRRRISASPTHGRCFWTQTKMSFLALLCWPSFIQIEGGRETRLDYGTPEQNWRMGQKTPSKKGGGQKKSEYPYPPFLLV